MTCRKLRPIWLKSRMYCHKLRPIWSKSRMYCHKLRPAWLKSRMYCHKLRPAWPKSRIHLQSREFILTSAKLCENASLCCGICIGRLADLTAREYRTSSLFRQIWVTIHGALHPAARHPADKVAVSGIQPVYTPFRSVLNKRHRRLGPPKATFQWAGCVTVCGRLGREL